MYFSVVYGFGFLGFIILFIAALTVRRVSGAVAAAIAAIVSFAVQWVILAALIGMGEAWSGDSGGASFLHILSLVFIFALILYCIVVGVRLDNRKPRSAISSPPPFRYATGELVHAGDQVRSDEDTGLIAFVSDNEFGEFLPEYMDQRGGKRGVMFRKHSGEMHFYDQVPSSLQFISRTTKAER